MALFGQLLSLAFLERAPKWMRCEAPRSEGGGVLYAVPRTTERRRQRSRSPFWCALLVYACVSHACPEPPPESPILGQWQFYKYIYKGEEHPPFNPNLILTFEFLADGSNRLHWERIGENGFCERKGEYRLEENNLVDKITWVNPKNNIDCSKDPDMQLGRETSTPVRFVDGDFHLILEMSGDPFIYVWKKLPAPPQSPN